MSIRPHVLIVDSSLDNCAVIASMLRDDYRISTVQSGLDALNLVRSAERIDLIKEVACHELAGTQLISTSDRKRWVSDLLDSLAENFKLRGKASPQNLRNIRIAKRDLGQHRALALTADIATRYMNARIGRGDKPASINRTTQLFKQAFKLAKLPCPEIARLSEKGNERRGFFEDADFFALLENIRLRDADLADFCEWAWLTGQRKSECASLRWEDLEGDTLRLRAKRAKNREARDIPIVGDRLLAIIERRRMARNVTAENGSVTVSFHRAGGPIREFRKSWSTACRLAGIDGRLFHDFRRTAARNLLKVGVTRETAKAITGHKTDSRFNRYTFPSAEDVRKAMDAVQSRPMQETEKTEKSVRVQ